MSIPVINRAGWQTISRRVVEWRRRIGTRNELMTLSDLMLSDHDPDLPFSRAEAQLEVQKWCWQA
jgi:uncharacterized protein YjiS (DUF1127 family)